MLPIPLPIKGIFKGFNPDVTSSEYSQKMNNMRPVDQYNNKIRLSQRPGLDKWGNGDQIGGTNVPVVEMAVISAVE